MKRRSQAQLHVHQFRRHHSLANERCAAADVVDRQGIATRAMADTKPALVVHPPDIVRRRSIDQWRRRWLLTTAPPARFHDTCALQNLVDRTAHGPCLVRMLTIKLPQDLLRSPRWVSLSHTQNCALHFRWRLVGVRLRRARRIREARKTNLCMPCQDLATRLPADPELATSFSHRHTLLQHELHEPLPLSHLVRLLPGHPSTRTTALPKVTLECCPCARTRVLPM